ncbi:DUF4383 domain-containing protein [Glycomyces tritici]|uniref:DUF4383 domain-containing protein n=1 Tax=Glycomyces tritici TaxID=2665176 RepID=A0ABT7YVW1_9ACTN|nr:DUF4383 domain-containing protein [Glycomyces tritici]MDN3242509.1 DUF4383 domain-containing protein [Glycomyces tritici]
MSDMQGASAARTPLRTTTMLVSAVFLLVGLLGFVPGITSDFSEMTFAGHHSSAMLFGVFAVSVLHNLVHVLFGIIGFLCAGSPGRSVAYLLYGGAIYLVLWLYGLVIDLESTANFVPVNSADNWLHFGLGAGMVVLGAVFGSSAKRSARAV